MSLLRAFIAVDISPEFQQAIRQTISSLQIEIESLVRWVPAENMHLTLKFLGDISPANVDILSQMIRAEADSCSSFDMRLNGLDSFPNLKRPRVIYIGIQAAAGLDALQRGVESAARKLGYESDANGGRAFSPHLTIGRVRQNISALEQQKIRRAIEGTKIDSPGTARVDSVHLYKSDLKPTGSVYTRLFSALLKKTK